MTTLESDYAAVVDAVRRQDRPEAINLAARALKRGNSHPLILVLAAEGLEERGRAAQAIDLLRAATAASPQHQVAWMRLAALLAKQRDFEGAAKAFDAVLGLDPNHFPALMGAGEMKLMLRDTVGAERDYRRAMKSDPRAAAPLAVLAVMAAQKRNVAEARDLARRAEAITPGIHGAEMALARADFHEGQAAASEARLTRLLERMTAQDENRAGALDLRAEALDAQGRYDEAFADYEARNAIAYRVNAPTYRSESIETPPRMARRLQAFLEADPSERWRARAGRDTAGEGIVRSHVFLLGFPRSGTTLLEKALGGHPDVVALEEVNHLVAASLDLRGDRGWDRLGDLSEDQADACRRTYWRLMRETLGDELDGKILIDKLPLHTLELPIIAKLFPDAKILFALRDPRDVVLSCFRRRFLINAAMFEYLTLEGAADFYDAAMSLAVTSRARLDLNLREVRHETVITDFDREVAEVLEFIGAEWVPEARNFADRVGGHMKTPSYVQLAKGLNDRGVGQWRRYETRLQPVLETLEPWVARYGYPPT